MVAERQPGPDAPSPVRAWAHLSPSPLMGEGRVGVESMQRGAYPETPPHPFPSPSRGGGKLALLAGLFLSTGLAFAQTAGPSDPRELVAAKQEAEQARVKSERLEQQAAQATGEAERARARSAAFAARIEAAEAE